MIRQTMRSAALAVVGLLLANVAWGQPVLRQSASAMQYVAAEYFGGEARMVQVSNMDLDMETASTGTQRPYVGLNLSGGPITDGNTADITFTLMGATFDQPVSPSLLDQRTSVAGPPFVACPSGEGGTTPTIGSNVEVTVREGGARGDSSVTFRVEVTDTADGNLVNAQSLCFWIPDLSVSLATVSAPGATPAMRGVRVTASAISPVATTGTAFPSRISGPATADTTEGGTGSAPNPGSVILQATPALTASVGMGDTAYVAITDRTKIARGGTPDPSASDPASAMMGLRVGTLSVGVSQNNIWELDGSGFLPKDEIDGSLSGQINLTVGGRFQSGDRVVVGSGPTALMATIDGMMAEASVQTAVIAGMNIVYVPGEVDALKPGTFTAGAAHLFNDRRNANGPIGMSTGEIKYAGIDVEGYAYGVVRGGAMDRSFVRVTCEGSTACAIFADCTGQDGMEYFEAAPPIDAGATVAWNSDDIEGLIGDDWTAGRGRCDVYSNNELSVQHLVRSGGILVNSSAVVGRSLDLHADRTRAMIEMVVDDICDAVVGHSGRDAHLGDADNPMTPDTSGPDGTDDPSNNVSAVDATTCRSLLAVELPDTIDANGEAPGN